MERPAQGTLRGNLRRQERRMSHEEIRAFLRTQRVAHVATKDAEGWPYVIPLVYIFEDDIIYLHTGAHEGHFLTNVRADPRVCVEVAEIGPLHPGKPYACNSSLVYTSVVAFGRLQIIDERAKKAWFFDRLVEKYADPGVGFEPGYPKIDRIILYSLAPEILTGKRSEGLRH